jgi:CRISPR/Cas system-associated exonuclease Cas4 (RecB family)
MEKEKPIILEKKPYAVKGERSRFDPTSAKPYTVSRSGIDRFMECPRCFYLEKRLGIGRPDTPGFSLNIAVDTLLKREFDVHRANGTAHPLMKEYNIDAIPYEHDQLEAWRDSLRRGIQFFHKPSGLIVRGGVDDVWVTPKGELRIVDYKATSKKTEVNIDGLYQQGYKRQMEVYQWLFRKNGFKVSDIGYFVYCNGDSDKEAFDAKLEFDVMVISYKGDDSWIEKTVIALGKCLRAKKLPASDPKCHYCGYVFERNKVEIKTFDMGN